MLVSERVLKWAMRCYPPFLFQGIWTKQFEKEFTGAQVKIINNIFNRNYNRTIFGGTIFSAADPYYVLLFYQILIRKGWRVKLWLKHSTIDFLRPGNCNLYFKINLSPEDIEEVVAKLESDGKFIKTFRVEITNKEGILYAVVHNEIYIRLYKCSNKHTGE
jgi:acyl-coenzyme A thioesterase PaaI-like protein